MKGTKKKKKIAQEDPELVLFESDSTFTDIDDQMLDSYLVAVALVRFTLWEIFKFKCHKFLLYISDLIKI